MQREFVGIDNVDFNQELVRGFVFFWSTSTVVCVGILTQLTFEGIWIGSNRSPTTVIGRRLGQSVPKSIESGTTSQEGILIEVGKNNRGLCWYCFYLQKITFLTEPYHIWLGSTLKINRRQTAVKGIEKDRGGIATVDFHSLFQRKELVVHWKGNNGSWFLDSAPHRFFQSLATNYYCTKSRAALSSSMRSLLFLFVETQASKDRRSDMLKLVFFEATYPAWCPGRPDIPDSIEVRSSRTPTPNPLIPWRWRTALCMLDTCRSSPTNYPLHSLSTPPKGGLFTYADQTTSVCQLASRTISGRACLHCSMGFSGQLGKRKAESGLRVFSLRIDLVQRLVQSRLSCR